ncbi:hypothetical protein L195_g025717 [Trifolium pratense]|uniref:Uncharacterized protein n=1 Tax=Trifolium pratense TaxID=57577 RepID=A0A2K3NHA8_TRIPR|nr:hypothetical protein L195_g025717 [Trifolium pratense]
MTTTLKPYPTSPAFQRFAVRTSKNIEVISKKADQKRQEFAEHLSKLESFKNQQ